MEDLGAYPPGVHATHHIAEVAFHDGGARYFSCTRCGGYSQAKVVKLKAPCAGIPADRTHASYVRRWLLDGRHPVTRRYVGQPRVLPRGPPAQGQPSVVAGSAPSAAAVEGLVGVPDVPLGDSPLRGPQEPDDAEWDPALQPMWAQAAAEDDDFGFAQHDFFGLD